MRSHEPDDLEPMDRHVVVDLHGNLTAVDWVGGMYAAGAITTDGRIVSTCFRQTDRVRGSASDLYVTERDGSTHNRTEGLDQHVGASLLAKIPTAITSGSRWIGIDGDDAIVPVLVGGALQVRRIALSGDVHVGTVLEGERGCNPIAMSNGKLLYASSTATQLPDLFLHDLATGDDQRLTDLNPDRPLGDVQVEALPVKSPDGTPVDAWFVHPPTGESPHPTVLLVHGGPFAAYGHAPNLNAQAMAHAGYGVLMSNPRGSVGYGSAFGTATRGDWGHLDFQDLMAVVDAAVEAGLADPDRLGVCGNSYGGYMTTWSVTHTDRFRAAVAENPVIDLRSFRGTSDIGITFTNDVMAGPLGEVPARYLDRSPLTHVHRCSTPTRLVVSESDRRVPPFQAEMFHSALREIGCPTDMVRLPGASHAGSTFGSPAVRRGQEEALLEWMDRYLGIVE